MRFISLNRPRGLWLFPATAAGVPGGCEVRRPAGGRCIQWAAASWLACSVRTNERPRAKYKNTIKKSSGLTVAFRRLRCPGRVSLGLFGSESSSGRQNKSADSCEQRPANEVMALQRRTHGKVVEKMASSEGSTGPQRESWPCSSLLVGSDLQSRIWSGIASVLRRLAVHVPRYRRLG